MSGLVGSTRINGGRDRFADFTAPLVYRLIGDSNTEGQGSSLEQAAGLRPWFLKYLESYRGDVRAVGTKSYGDSFWGSATYGSMFNRFQWWEHDAMPGEKIGYEVPSVSATSGSATLTSATVHGLGVGAIWRWTTAPAPFVDDALYIVASVPTTSTFTLKATSAGAAVQATASGSGFVGLTGLISLPPILAASAPVRENMVCVPSAGTNDINVAVNAGSTAQAAATETHRRVRLLIEQMLRAWPGPDQLFLFGGLPPFFPGSASGGTWATKQAAVVLYRDLLAAEIASRGSRFRYRNIWEDVTAGDNNGDGVHFLSPAYRASGVNLGELAKETTRGAVSGRAWPRSFLKRERVPKLALTGTTGRVTGPSTSIGENSVLVALAYKPDTGDLPADTTTRFLMWLGSADYNTGIGIACRSPSGTAGRSGLNVYHLGVAVQSGSSGYNSDDGTASRKVFREGEWADWVVLFNRESLRCVTWKDGEMVNNVSISAAWNIAANTWKIGHISGALPAAEGHYQDFEIAIGSQLTVAACAEWARARYAERSRFDGTADYRRLNEGTGTAAASTVNGLASATLSGLSGWVDADTSVAPWEL